MRLITKQEKLAVLKQFVADNPRCTNTQILKHLKETFEHIKVMKSVPAMTRELFAQGILYRETVNGKYRYSIADIMSRVLNRPKIVLKH